MTTTISKQGGKRYPQMGHAQCQSTAIASRNVSGATTGTATLVGTWLGSKHIDLNTELRYLDQ